LLKENFCGGGVEIVVQTYRQTLAGFHFERNQRHFSDDEIGMDILGDSLMIPTRIVTARWTRSHEKQMI
jgi:hypothetical protein